MQAENVSAQNFVEEYKVLYHAYQQLNCFCWQNRLPLCRIAVFRRGSCDAAVACLYKEKPYHTIGLNLSYLEYDNDKGIMLILAHEMVHIWQFSGLESRTSESMVLMKRSGPIHLSNIASMYAKSCGRTLPTRSGK